jgi:hypothetical protein
MPVLRLSMFLPSGAKRTRHVPAVTIATHLLIRMKRCPNCNQVYTDPTLNFCLADGYFLLATTGPNVSKIAPTISASEAPTEALPAKENPRRETAPPTIPSLTPSPARPLYTPALQTPTATPDRKTFLWVIIVILFVGVVALAYLLIRKSSNENQTDVSASTGNSNSSSTSARSTPGATITPTPIATPSATRTPTPTPTPTPDTASARSDVLALMNSWAESLRKQDLSSNTRLYAERLDSYYQLGSVSREQVRANRQAIFNRYSSSTNVQLSNISVEIDSSGTRATVSYDNSYNWRGGPKYLTGKSHNMMVLSKFGSQWLITSEKHLQTYYEDSGG